MKEFTYSLALLLLSIQSCGIGSESADQLVDPIVIIEEKNISDYKYSQDQNANRVETRFPTPEGFNRTELDSGSFGTHLRNLELKPIGSVVKTYNGESKENFGVYEAVVKLEIGKKDLHQCADAVMRLRGDYLWESKRYDEIHFNFTNGFRVDYSEWMKGKRMVVKGNQTHWTQSGGSSNTYEDYWNYLELIFTYAGSLSLSKELKSVDVNEMEIGDVFIYGGSPGHAVIVIDMCENPETGERKFMLAQSYMPAQEIQVLSNPNSEEGDPWYSLNFEGELETPEWTFDQTSLMRFTK